MRNRECSTQAEADAAAMAGDVIVWREGALILRGSSHAHLHDNSVAHLYGSSHAHLHDSSVAHLYGSSHAHLHGSSSAALHDSSSAYLYDNSSAYLYDSSRAHLYDSSAAVDGLTGATLRRDHPRLILGQLGSSRDTLGVSLPPDGSEPVVYASCRKARPTN